MGSASYKYPISLVSACLLGTGRGTSYYHGGPIYRAPVSDRDLFDAPLPEQGPITISPFILADVNFKGNFEEWFSRFPGMIVVRKGWNVIKGRFLKNLAYSSDIVESLQSYNERKLRLINVKTNNAKVADGKINSIAYASIFVFLILLLYSLANLLCIYDKLLFFL